VAASGAEDFLESEVGLGADESHGRIVPCFCGFVDVLEKRGPAGLGELIRPLARIEFCLPAETSRCSAKGRTQWSA
jgi:hypothetical protein